MIWLLSKGQSTGCHKSTEESYQTHPQGIREGRSAIEINLARRRLGWQRRDMAQKEGTACAKAQRQIRTRHIDELNMLFRMADTRKREWWQNSRLEL